MPTRLAGRPGGASLGKAAKTIHRWVRSPLGGNPGTKGHKGRPPGNWHLVRRQNSLDIELGREKTVCGHVIPAHWERRSFKAITGEDVRKQTKNPSAPCGNCAGAVYDWQKIQYPGSAQ